MSGLNLWEIKIFHKEKVHVAFVVLFELVKHELSLHFGFLVCGVSVEDVDCLGEMAHIHCLLRRSLHRE